VKKETSDDDIIQQFLTKHNLKAVKFMKSIIVLFLFWQICTHVQSIIALLLMVTSATSFCWGGGYRSRPRFICQNCWSKWMSIVKYWRNFVLLSYLIEFLFINCIVLLVNRKRLNVLTPVVTLSWLQHQLTKQVWRRDLMLTMALLMSS